jgi:hypothetical protein
MSWYQKLAIHRPTLKALTISISFSAKTSICRQLHLTVNLIKEIVIHDSYTDSEVSAVADWRHLILQMSSAVTVG